MADDLAYALAAGMVASVNPCGFAMLPGYLTMVVTGDQDASRTARIGRALAASALMAAGFIVVFGLFGLASAPLASTLQSYLPVVTVVIGVAMLVIGVLMLAGKELTLLVPKLNRGAPTTRVTSMLGYGVAFAVASLSCTIGPFMAAAGVALRNGDGFLTFVTYGLGMGLVVAVLAVAAAVASTAVASGIRRLLPHVGRIGGVLLVVTGAYVGYYGYTELRATAGTDPVVRAAADVQAVLVEWVTAIGPAWFAVILAVLVTGGVLLAKLRRSASRQT